MSRTLKILIGLAATWAMGWAWHGPLGHGAAFVAGIEGHAKAMISYSHLPGISVRFGKNPLSRNAVVRGPADAFQRHGMADEPGLAGRIATIPGIGGVRWDDEPRPAGWAPPLLVETLAWLTLFYALGFCLGALLFGRRRRTSFLD